MELTPTEMIEADEFFLERAIDDLEEHAGTWHAAEILRRELEKLESHLRGGTRDHLPKREMVQ
jgi:hypothetical protein